MARRRETYEYGKCQYCGEWKQSKTFVEIKSKYYRKHYHPFGRICQDCKNRWKWDKKIRKVIRVRPFDHQRKAFKKVIKKFFPEYNAAALLMEQGTGKTLVAIAVAGHLFREGKIKKALIVAPLMVLGQWERQFAQYARFPYQVLPLYDRGNPTREKILRQEGDSSALQVALINYESSWRIKEQLARWKPDLIICDESQKIKSPHSEQSKGMHYLGDRAKYRMILTGTPIANNHLDVWSQYRFLQPSIFGTKWTAFRDRYAKMHPIFKSKVVRFRRPNELRNKMHRIAFRVTKAQALDLPPELYQTLTVMLEDEALDLYEKMNEELLLWLLDEGDTVTATVAATKILKLQQIAGGFVFDDDGDVHQVSRAKLRAIEELFEGFPPEKKVVVFARFTPEVEAIADTIRRTGRTVLTITGQTRHRKEVVERFQNDPHVSALVLQIQTGGVGIDLHAADTAIFYSLTYSYLDYEQAKARVHRLGQRNKVTYIHLVAAGTVDEDILEAIQAKKDVADFVVDRIGRRLEEMAKKTKKKGTSDLREKLMKLKAEIEEVPEEELEEDEVEVRSTEPPKIEKPRKRKRERAEKAEPKGDIVTAKDLADEFKLTPKALRKILRKARVKRPGGRWEWEDGSPELEEVREVLRQHA